jgi:hypothetical protein
MAARITHQRNTNWSPDHVIPDSRRVHPSRHHRRPRHRACLGSLAMRTMPKSLHTVTALVNVARHLRRDRPDWTNARAVEWAADVLGYGFLGYRFGAGVDPYGLKAKALAILEGGK